MNKSNELIIKNYNYFNQNLKIVELLYNSKKYEDCILFIEKIALSAWCNYNGLYVSYILEDYLASIAFKTLDFKAFSNEKKINEKKQFKTLHIFSELYKQGGHTKVLFNWVKQDILTHHYFLSTWMKYEDVNEIASNYYDYTIEISRFFGFKYDLSLLVKSQEILNYISENEFDNIILHVHQHDVLPILVFSNNYIKIPIYFFNHADHIFWLGASVSDLFLAIRKSIINEDVYRRFISSEKQFFLPLPIDISTEKSTEKINKNTFNILSIGIGYKYIPNSEYNFFRESIIILNKNKNVIITIIGIDIEIDSLKNYKHERLIILKPVHAGEIDKYYRSADLYIQGFPFGSYTALIEAAYFDTPFVLQYNPFSIIRLFEDDPNHYIKYPDTLEGWHNFINKMINDKEYYQKVKEIQCQYIQYEYSNKQWKEKMDYLKNLTKSIEHKYEKKITETKIKLDRNEIMLNSMHRMEIDHFKNTENLNIFDKFKVIYYYINSPKWVVKKDLVFIINYLFNFSHLKS